MSLAKMQKIRLVGHDTERERVLTTLQELGVVQISDLTTKNEQSLSGFRPKTPPTNEIESKLADLRYALDFLARYDTEKKGFIQGFFNLKELIRPEEIERIARAYDYRALCQRVRDLDQENIALHGERVQLEARRAELLPWRDLPIPVEKLRSTQTTALILGRLPKENLVNLQRAIQNQLADLVLFQRAGEDETTSYFYAFVLKDSEEAFEKMLAEHGGERLPDLPQEAHGLPKEILEQIERRLSELDARHQQLSQQATALLAEKSKLQALYDYLHNEYLKAQAQAQLLGSPHTFVLEGWVRQSDWERLQRALQNNSEAVYLGRIAPDPDEVPPVALENKRLFQPAEFLIKLFGLPNQKELDPTPFVLPFFAIFFGIALTDAGYGLALILIFSYLKRRYSHKRGFQPFANLIILGGISAVIAGALTGGWFGPDLAQAFSALRALVLFDVSTPAGLIAFLLFSFALGFLQVLLGNLLEFYDKARSGRFWEALWHEGSWVVFIVGLGIVAGVSVPAIMPKELHAPGLPASWMPVGIYLTLTGAFLVLFFSRVEFPERVSRQLPWLLAAAGLVLWLGSSLIVWGQVLVGLGIGGALMVTPQSGLSVGARVRSVLGRVGAGLFRLYGATGLLGDVLSYSRIMALGISTGLIADSMNKLALMMLGIPFIGVVLCVALLIGLQIFSLVINSLSAFVHAARLHYVEFFTKFYESGGEAFKPFARESVYYDVEE
ncbi:MAG: V-type ATP synthase subunit I [Candidatus Bipolaricaulota bacterium]|nr:V-type ATP synthase subunit I [Candidatus Bipolaricaulota bacterium]